MTDSIVGPDTRACIYASTAQVSQSEEADAMHMVSLAQIAEAKGAKVVSTYFDWGVSGRGDKPGLQALIEAAQRAEFDVVVVRDFSNLGRDSARVMRVLQTLRMAQVKIWTPDMDPIDDLLAMLIGMMRTTAARDLGRRISRGKKLAAASRLAAQNDQTQKDKS
ncbi:recombinase family protein [Brevundimonas sp. TSRC1-1]|uniref:recombinase family protein n=1 Tax=Brevundimonas sp. TSRC1-1 TaxID=2804562 RepID=UPI003CF32075